MTQEHCPRRCGGSTARSRSWTSRATSRRRRRTRSARPTRRAAEGGTRAVVLNFTGPRVHELGWDRAARDAARAREPGEAEAARVRADRPLPADLRADAPRRGDRHLRRPRPRPSRPPAREERGAMSERIGTAEGDVGEAGRDADRRRGAARARRTSSRASGSSGPSRASGSCGRRPTRCGSTASRRRRQQVIATWRDGLRLVLAEGQRLLPAAHGRRARARWRCCRRPARRG